ncbi:MAG: LON peptidase substrate-binding domain-containing protein [Thermomicrobiales bacterium]
MYSAPIPLLPLKNVVIFPRNVVTMLVGRARSIQAVEEALTRDRRIVVTTHKDSEIDDPRPDDLHRVGTLVEIISVERQQGSNIQVILEGLARVSILSFDNSRPFYWVEAEPVVEEVVSENEGAILAGVVHDLIQRYSETKNKLNPEVMEMILQTNDPSHLADLVTTQLITDAARRQEYLENPNLIDRLGFRSSSRPTSRCRSWSRRSRNGSGARSTRTSVNTICANSSRSFTTSCPARRQRDRVAPEAGRGKGLPEEAEQKVSARDHPARADAGRLGRGHDRSQLHRYRSLDAVA